MTLTGTANLYYWLVVNMPPERLLVLLGMFCLTCSHCGDSSHKVAHQAGEVFCVSQGIDGSHHNQDSTECHTLAYYMNHSSEHFKSYETYVFQRGKHNPLDQFTLNISNVTNLKLVGPDKENTSEAAVIDCNGRSAAFVFRYSSNIIIENLTFSACIQKHNSDIKINHGLATLTFYKGCHLSLLGVTVLMSVDEAFYIENVLGNIVLSNLEVANSNTDGKVVPYAGNTIAYQYCHEIQTSKVFITDSRFINNSNFVRNKFNHVQLYAGGLSISLECPNIEVKIDNLTMSNNTGGSGGNLELFFQSFYTYFNVSVEIHNSHFEGGNAAHGGGGIFAEFVDGSQGSDSVVCKTNSHHHKLLYVYNTTFANNGAQYSGGGVYLKQKQSLSSCNIETITFVNVTFNDNFVVKTGNGGIALHSIKFLVTDYLPHQNSQFHIVLVSCSTYNNHAKTDVEDGSGTGVIFTKSNHYFQLINTTIFNNKVTGILGMSSNIILSGNITIVNNTGSSGGGLLLCQNAVIYLEAHTNITIAHNSANHTGGGICVETDYLESKPICFFQLGRDPLIHPSHVKTINISLYDNHAGFAGNNIFGGSIDYCYMIDSPKHKANRSTEIYTAIFSVPNNTESTSSVTSLPRNVCLCQNNKPSCEITAYNLKPLFPGENFSIEAVLVGQFYGSVPGTVQATMKYSNSEFGQYESVQKISTYNCTQLRYTIYTNHWNEVLELGVQHEGDVSGFEQLQFHKYYIDIHVRLKECPLGFTRTTGKHSFCDCSWLFSHHTEYVSCEIKTQTIKRVPPVWIGFVEVDNGSKTVAYHSHCPLDYCVSTENYLDATTNSLSQDEQCAFNRTGVLCGSCSAGLSIVLGNSECHSCSNYWLLLHLPFVLIGVILVIVLTMCNITIAEGTLSGIIFYCNIIGSNVSIFFPRQNITFLTPSLKMFVLLINLETGIPLCLFNGMDAYTKCWLHFVFPLYLWFISGVFIYLGGRFSWIVRRNAVKVLATLILLSYARFLSAVTDALQLSYVYLDNGDFERRWLIDGNIHYFKGRHIPLAVFALLFSLFLLPFSLCLFFIQCLQKASHYQICAWVNRLKPFFDAYTGPFTSSGRFWTGLLLLSRGLLFTVSAVNTSGDPRSILGTTAFIVILLLVVAGILPAGLYQWRCLNVLEFSSLLNLGVLTSLLFIFTKESVFSVIVPHICVSVALLTFIGVIVYHITRLNPIKNNIRKCCWLVRILQHSKRMNTITHLPTFTSDELSTAHFPHYEPFNEDREPLLATDNEE